MANTENFDDQEMKKIMSRYKMKPVPDSLMKNYLAEVRKKIQIEKSSGSGFGFPVWMGALVFAYTLALAFSFGVYWVEGRPDFSKPVVAVPESEVTMREATPIKVQEQSSLPTAPEAVDVKIESDAELAAILSVLGEDDNLLDDQELSRDIERLDQWEIQGPAAQI